MFRNRKIHPLETQTHSETQAPNSDNSIYHNTTAIYYINENDHIITDTEIKDLEKNCLINFIKVPFKSLSIIPLCICETVKVSLACLVCETEGDDECLTFSALESMRKNIKDGKDGCYIYYNHFRDRSAKSAEVHGFATNVEGIILPPDKEIELHHINKSPIKEFKITQNQEIVNKIYINQLKQIFDTNGNDIIESKIKDLDEWRNKLSKFIDNKNIFDNVYIFNNSKSLHGVPSVPTLEEISNFSVKDRKTSNKSIVMKPLPPSKKPLPPSITPLQPSNIQSHRTPLIRTPRITQGSINGGVLSLISNVNDNSIINDFKEKFFIKNEDYKIFFDIITIVNKDIEKESYLVFYILSILFTLNICDMYLIFINYPIFNIFINVICFIDIKINDIPKIIFTINKIELKKILNNENLDIFIKCYIFLTKNIEIKYIRAIKNLFDDKELDIITLYLNEIKNIKNGNSFSIQSAGGVLSLINNIKINKKKLNEYNMKELHKIAKIISKNNKKFTGYSKLNKADLIEKIIKNKKYIKK